MKAPKSTPTPAISDALKLSLVDGEVVFLGDRLGFSMTPTAAAETSARLAALLRRSDDQARH
ncbi:MAG: hypothetical protein JWP28_3635 [Phenylobacterium sp.]|jgi:hypothetical protein|uniref:hypothetical protein n=1 Tax=Phenylobacterium sp. TaxID=1871053 RepID=UPI002629BAEC|nr:hypothetical protein [Phenylobacterium sp.]MDB5427010.1 hypothetical protein [Phenylobacterium sp.]MDB5499604.1 hypothetical protein [Phenylobacterium sp.]